MPRRLRALPVPSGPGVLDLLDPLRRALDGTGPALLPVPADAPAEAARLLRTLGADPDSVDGPEFRGSTEFRGVPDSVGGSELPGGAEFRGVPESGVGHELAPAEDPDGDPTALVIATSGSTGEAKGVLLGAGALRASASATHDRLGGPGRWLLALPARHIAGVQVLVRGLLAGHLPAVLDLTDGFRPDAFAAAAAPLLAEPGPHYTSLVPTQLTRLLADPGAGLTALTRFDAVLLGGAALPAPLRARAESAGVRVVTTYGMSETAGGCVYDQLPLADVHLRITAAQISAVRDSAFARWGSDSDAFPAQQVGRDVSDAVVADGVAGAVGISGPMLATGYRLRPELTAAAFRDGWFRTGDLGRITGGRLEILGRADDLINSGGVKIAPVLVERVLAAVPGVAEVCVLGVADPEWGQAVAAAVVPADPADPPAPDVLRAAVRDQLGRSHVPKRIGYFDTFPVRGPGKTDRNALRSVFMNNDR